MAILIITGKDFLIPSILYEGAQVLLRFINHIKTIYRLTAVGEFIESLVKNVFGILFNTGHFLIKYFFNLGIFEFNRCSIIYIYMCHIIDHREISIVTFLIVNL